MGEAIVSGLLRAGWATAGELLVVETSPERRQVLAALLEGVDVAEAPAPRADVLLAVKPGDVPAVCRHLAASAPPRRVLSVAAGVTIAELEGHLGAVAVVRAMPNTPALVGAGVAAIAPGARAGVDDLAWARSILGAVGTVVTVDERQLDAVTGLSGSGPAYLFLVAEALVEAGVLLGLARPVSEELANRTILGAGQLLVEGGRSAAELRADVTSPGGTTAAALRELERRGVRSALIEAVAAAAERSSALGAPRPPA